MLIVSSNIASNDLFSKLQQHAGVVFEDTLCTVALSNGTLIGDSPYGYIDFMMPVSLHACEALVKWTKAWATFSPSVAFC
jgi:hypothetical protein